MGFPLRVRARKPKGTVGINRAHPLAREVAFFYYETAGNTIFDAVTGLRAGTAAGQVTSSEGYLSFDGSAKSSTSSAFFNPDPAGAYTTDKLTVVAGARLASKPTNHAVAVFYGTAGSTRGAWCGFSAAGFAGGGCLGTNGVVTNYDSTDHSVNRDYVVIAGSGDGGTGGGSYGFVNGQLVGSNFSGSSTAQTPTRTCLGRDDSGYWAFFTGELIFAMGFNRILTVTDHYQLAKNPWQILSPVRDIRLMSLGDITAPAIPVWFGNPYQGQVQLPPESVIVSPL